MFDHAGEIITFYSYKGGTGRSMALSNVACILAQNKLSKVLMIDWDLEAPGLHLFFRNRLKNDSEDIEENNFDYAPGIIDLFYEIADFSTNSHNNEENIEDLFKKLDIRKYIIRTAIPNLFLIKAGRFDENYSYRVNNFNWPDLYRKFPWIFRSLAESLSEHYHYILIDSRTGITDTSGITTMLMPDKLVTVFTPNRQSIIGTLSLIRQATNYRKQSNDLRPIIVFPLPSRIEADEPDLRKKWRFGDKQQDLQGYQPEFEKLFRDVYDIEECNLNDYFDEVQIQHIPRYSYGEEIAALDEPSKDRLSLTKSYENFAKKMDELYAPWEKIQIGSALSTMWNLPSMRNTNFTGREGILDEMHAALTSGNRSAWKQALVGLGGVGKTQIAKEYAYRYNAEYKVVWWVSSENPTSIAMDYACLAEELDLPEKESIDQSRLISAVKSWLEHNPNWLLIFDNISDQRDIVRYLPVEGSGHVIITSRNPNWGSIASILLVEPFGPQESVEFICRRTNQKDRTMAKKLAEEMGYLPLALEQAGAYIEETGISLSDYLFRFKKHRMKVLERGKPADYSDTVASTWEMTFQAVKEKSPASADLLNICAFLAPVDIPKSLILGGRKDLPEPLASFTVDEFVFDDIVAELRRYSLISGTGDQFSVHQLVQAMTRDRLGEEERENWSAISVRILNSAFQFDPDNVKSWENCASLLLHALSLAVHAEDLGVLPEQTAEILNNAGRYQQNLADFGEARKCLERALKIDEKIFGLDHPSVAKDINNLGLVLKDLGEMEKARESFERALKIDEKVFGLEHPIVATTVNNLGSVLRDLGEMEMARECVERALKIDETVFGINHPSVARDVSSLGLLLKDLGEMEMARECVERALKIDETVFGLDHPSVARDVNNLGLLLKDLGEMEKARSCFERALKIDETVFGLDHPSVARDVNNLGLLLKDLGEMEKARSCFERALKIGETVFGLDHPSVARDVNNLGLVLKDLGEREKARECFERALKIDERAFGLEHPSVAIDVNNLGSVLQDLGELEKAKSSFERSLRILQKFFGNNHPLTRKAKANLDVMKFSKL